jgi:hypothetical protein
MVLVRAALDAAVGLYLVVHGLRRGKVSLRYVGLMLLLCAAMLLAVPWLTAPEASPYGPAAPV